MSRENVQPGDYRVIQEAVDRFRGMNPESYLGISDTALVVNVLETAGLYGRAAGKAQRKLHRISEILREE